MSMTHAESCKSWNVGVVSRTPRHSGKVTEGVSGLISQFSNWSGKSFPEVPGKILGLVLISSDSFGMGHISTLNKLP